MFRFVPLIAIIVLGAIALVWRPWLQRRRHGTWGILLFRAPRWQDRVRDGLAILLFALLFAQAVAAALSPEPPPGSLDILQPLGAALTAFALVLLVSAQLDLGASWRIGVDEQARPGLVTGGLYRFSRNPIYLALLIFIVGYALLLPTLLSLALLIGFYIGVRQQIAAEEDYLLRAYGDAFRAYGREVGRFVPFVGRLK